MLEILQLKILNKFLLPTSSIDGWAGFSVGGSDESVISALKSAKYRE